MGQIMSCRTERYPLVPTAETGRSRWDALIGQLPPGQFMRYLVVGAGNTAFAYGNYALLTAVLQPHFAHGYVGASLLSGFLNITVAFLGYKWFVFKTKGNYVREWLRAVAVYSTALVASTASLPPLVVLLRRWTGVTLAPYVAGAVVMFFTVLYSFFGHRKFSFRAGRPS